MKKIEYVVFITVTDRDGNLSGEPGFYNGTDYNSLYKFEVTVNSGYDETTAIDKALNYYYEKFWSNTNTNKELFDQELDKFKKGLDKLETESYLDYLPNKEKLINDFQKELRSNLSCTDKRINEFDMLSINIKINYLSDLGCYIDYFVVPKKFINKFETIKLEF